MPSPSPALDISLLQCFPPPQAFVEIDKAVRESIQPFKQTAGRIRGVEHHCHRMASDYFTFGDIERSEIYMRAALAEFSSMDDALLNDLKDLSHNARVSICGTNDPRLHAVKLLRHTNVHLKATKLVSSQTPATWTVDNTTIHFNYTAYLICDADASISASRDSKKYKPHHLKAMTCWLTEEQQAWGVQNIILRATEEFARIIVEKCSLPEQA